MELTTRVVPPQLLYLFILHIFLSLSYTIQEKDAYLQNRLPGQFPCKYCIFFIISLICIFINTYFQIVKINKRNLYHCINIIESCLLPLLPGWIMDLYPRTYDRRAQKPQSRILFPNCGILCSTLSNFYPSSHQRIYGKYPSYSDVPVTIF